MTSPSRRKRPTTARAPSTAATTACRPARWLVAAGLGLLLAAAAPGREPTWSPAVRPPSPPQQPAQTQRPPAIQLVAQPQPAPLPQPPALPPAPYASPPATQGDLPLKDVLPQVLGALGTDPVVMQRAAPAGGVDFLGAGDETPFYQIQLDPPGPERYFRLDSERELFERLRQQGRDQRRGVYDTTADLFPEQRELSQEPYTGRHWSPLSELAEPGYTCYGKLLFEQLNEERYGWDLGAIQPFVSLGEFYFDMATLPYHLASRPLCKHDCSAGLCLPGDPVPYLIYPPEISVTGALAEVSTAVVLFVLFP